MAMSILNLIYGGLLKGAVAGMATLGGDNNDRGRHHAACLPECHRFPRPRIRCVPRIVAFDRLQRANGGEKNPPR